MDIFFYVDAANLIVAVFAGIMAIKIAYTMRGGLLAKTWVAVSVAILLFVVQDAIEVLSAHEHAVIESQSEFAEHLTESLEFFSWLSIIVGCWWANKSLKV